MTTMQLEKDQQEVFQKEVQPIVNYANALTIKTQEDSTAAQEGLKELKRRKIMVHEKFDPPVRAAHVTWKLAKDLYNFFVNPFDEAETIIKRKVVTFESEAQRKRDEEARIAEAKRQADERKRREEIERQAKAAEEKGKTEKAEALREKAETFVAAPIFTPPPSPKVQGTSFRSTWKAEVTDIKSLCQSILDGKLPVDAITPNYSVLNKLAGAYKNTSSIPGVKFSEEKTMSVRGAA